MVMYLWLSGPTMTFNTYTQRTTAWPSCTISSSTSPSLSSLYIPNFHFCIRSCSATVGVSSKYRQRKKWSSKSITKYKAIGIREVGLPEAVSHLLEFPDHYTDAKFVPVSTTQLFYHFQALNPDRLRDV